jgi:hypothetical protein
MSTKDLLAGTGSLIRKSQIPVEALERAGRGDRDPPVP